MSEGEIFDDYEIQYYPPWTNLTSQHEEICFGIVGAYLDQNAIVWYSNVFCLPIIAGLGVLSNVINVIVLYSRGSRLQSSCYLLVLAVCDCLFLVFGTLEITPITLDILSVNALFNMWYTALVLYIRVAAASAFKSSVWLVVAFNLERYISVCYPLYSHSFCNKSTAKRICVITVLCCFMLSIHWPLTYQRTGCLNPATNETFYFIHIRPELSYQTYERTMNYLNMILFTVAPILLLCVLNCLLIRALHAVIRKDSTMDEQLGRRRSSQWSAHAILFAVVAMFLLCNGPQIFARILYEIYGPENQLVMNYMALSQQLIFLNASINFSLYCLVSRRYRHILKKTLQCACSQKLRCSLENFPQPIRLSPRCSRQQCLSNHRYSKLRQKFVSNNLHEENLSSWQQHYV